MRRILAGGTVALCAAAIVSVALAEPDYQGPSGRLGNRKATFVGQRSSTHVHAAPSRTPQVGSKGTSAKSDRSMEPLRRGVPPIPFALQNAAQHSPVRKSGEPCVVAVISDIDDRNVISAAAMRKSSVASAGLKGAPGVHSSNEVRRTSVRTASYANQYGRQPMPSAADSDFLAATPFDAGDLDIGSPLGCGCDECGGTAAYATRSCGCDIRPYSPRCQGACAPIKAFLDKVDVLLGRLFVRPRACRASVATCCADRITTDCSTCFACGCEPENDCGCESFPSCGCDSRAVSTGIDSDLFDIPSQPPVPPAPTPLPRPRSRPDTKTPPDPFLDDPVDDRPPMPPTMRESTRPFPRRFRGASATPRSTDPFFAAQIQAARANDSNRVIGMGVGSVKKETTIDAPNPPSPLAIAEPSSPLAEPADAPLPPQAPEALKASFAEPIADATVESSVPEASRDWGNSAMRNRFPVPTNRLR